MNGFPLATEENYRDVQFSVPWQYSPSATTERDADGFPLLSGSGREDPSAIRKILQATCWQKFHQNPHVNTSVRDLVGRITGEGFATIPAILDPDAVIQIEDVISEVETDYRNRLYDYWPKFITRAMIEGELFLCFTCHRDGFIEIDFYGPEAIDGGNEHGILFHPRKTRMPLIYCLSNDDDISEKEHIPSIYLARYPTLINMARTLDGYSAGALQGSKSRAKAFRPLGGFFRFMVSWDLGLITKRSVSHLQTILEWLNYWEMLKKYEIDHKKSAGAYLWVVEFSDTKSWITWLNLSDEERKKTGLAAVKTPGGTLVIGPNMKVTAQNPNLQKISESDTDIMGMITSGLTQPEDMLTGQSKGTFASSKTTRGPLSDRISDEIAYFSRWLRYDFWGNIFFLKSVLTGFPETFTVREAVGFGKNKKPVFRDRQKPPHECIDIRFPVSAIDDAESIAKALFGVKHGSLNDTAGIPISEMVKKLGFRGYLKLRLKQATEKEQMPELISTADAESVQEKREAEPGKDGNTPRKDASSANAAVSSPGEASAF